MGQKRRILQKHCKPKERETYLGVQLQSASRKRLSGGRQKGRSFFQSEGSSSAERRRHGQRSTRVELGYTLWKIMCPWRTGPMPTKSLRAFYKRSCHEWEGHSASCPPVALLPANWVRLLLGVEPKDITKPKPRRRKGYYSQQVRRKLGIFSKGVSPQTAKLGKF